MASSSKKKTTFAKITRENAVRERRMRKQAKKDTKEKEGASLPGVFSETPPIPPADPDLLPDGEL